MVTTRRNDSPSASPFAPPFASPSVSRTPSRRFPAGLVALWLGAGAASAGAAGAGCLVHPDVYDEVYFCDGSDQSTCADSYACLSSTRGNFCAATCDYDPAIGGGTGCDDGSVCGDQGLCVETCTTSSDCRAGLTCVFSESGRYCATAYGCSADSDCQQSFDEGFTPDPGSNCSSNLVPDGNTCVFGCTSDAQCPPGDDCVGENPPNGRGLCAPPCTPTGGCPPTYTCAQSAYADYDGHCLPGLATFPCASDVNCLVGACETNFAGEPDMCTVACTTDADCADYMQLGFAAFCQAAPETGGNACLLWGEACGATFCPLLDGHFCATAFFGAIAPQLCGQFCDPAACPTPGAPTCNCPAGEACALGDGMGGTGLCASPCMTAADCAVPNFGCLRGVLPTDPGYCVPGTAFVRCDTAANCMTGGECINILGANLCQFPCAVDADCAGLNPQGQPGAWTCTLDLDPFNPSQLYCQAPM
jgi:hypothetical protein